MKYSIYNSILPLNDKMSVVYSALTDEFVVLKKHLEPLLRQCSPQQLESETKSLYEELVKSGAIIEDHRNEYGELCKRSFKACNSQQEYKLIINPTVDCNFRCWYCYETHMKDSKMSINTIESIKKLICNILSEKKELKRFDISFFGGEPLLYYNDTVRHIIDFFRQESNKYDINKSISFTSNGFLITDNIVSHLKEGDEPLNFQITLDGHRDLHNEVRNAGKDKSSYDIILNSINNLLKAQIGVVLRINYTTENIGSVMDILEDIKNIGKEERKWLSIGFHRVWQDHKAKGLKECEGGDQDSVLEKTIEAFRDEFMAVSDHLNINELRYPCYADKDNEVVVNYNGDLFKCTARDFLKENRYGVLSENGELVWSEKREIRHNAKMKRDVCKNCRILPLCGGGCSQKAVEVTAKDICISNMSEAEKDEVIMQRFFLRFVKNSNKNTQNS